MFECNCYKQKVMKRNLYQLSRIHLGNLHKQHLLLKLLLRQCRQEVCILLNLLLYLPCMGHLNQSFLCILLPNCKSCKHLVLLHNLFRLSNIQQSILCIVLMLYKLLGRQCIPYLRMFLMIHLLSNYMFELLSWLRFLKYIEFKYTCAECLCCVCRAGCRRHTSCSICCALC